MALTKAVLEGNRLALARLLTQVENDTAMGRAVLSELFSSTGRAHLIGVTGAPGTGKSSLVNQLALYLRRSPEIDGGETQKPPQVAIVAVDPSSPFTGGALLGDRIRMRDLSGDSGIFIRSMASRGSLGGLAGATASVVQVLDAAGYEIILIETVGAGQAEVDIARLAYTTLVVEAPGLGDDVQAIKAGILEIADILVVNKADLPGVETAERALRGMLQLAHPVRREFVSHHSERMAVPATGELEEGGSPPDSEGTNSSVAFWIPLIRRTIATDGTGIPELAASIKEHYNYLRQTGEWQQRDQTRLQTELDVLLRETLMSRWRASVSESQYGQVLQEVYKRELSPWQAVDTLIDGGLA
ncbi:methylmalonyl Co-A mutase-associated GTPase MeaB [Chloroflexota bacterium]